MTTQRVPRTVAELNWPGCGTAAAVAPQVALFARLLLAAAAEAACRSSGIGAGEPELVSGCRPCRLADLEGALVEPGVLRWRPRCRPPR